MQAFALGKSTAVMGAAILLSFGSTACATKKYVRQTVTPVEARVSGVEKKTTDQASAIGELENNVSRADEKAAEGIRAAQAANQAADKANQAAVDARARADAAASMSEQNASRIGQLGQTFEKLDNYQLTSTESVLFPFNKYTLTDEAKATLDQAVTGIKGAKNYVLEIRGFTDKTGSQATNLALSQKRADAVVRYLTNEHEVPLRKIHVLGLGEEDKNADEQKTRDARKQARRVELKVWTVDLGVQSANKEGSQTQSNADQMRARQTQQ
jgi:outer membrane protein OmpA-like peptidoglycan-associated protein